jgi:hypothetical protein
MSHPVTNDPMRWQQDIPMDMQILIDLLVRDLGSHDKYCNEIAPGLMLYLCG